MKDCTALSQFTPCEADFQPSAAQRRVIVRYTSPPWPSFNESARLERVSPTYRAILEARAHGQAFRSQVEALEEYLRELDASIAGLGQKALDALMQGMDGPDPRVQSQNARWVLEQLRGKATPRHEEEIDDTGDSVPQMRELLRTPITVNYADPSGRDGWQPQDMQSPRQ